MLYPQNGDRIMTINSVTSLHPMCIFMTIYMYKCKKKLLQLVVIIIIVSLYLIFILLIWCRSDEALKLYDELLKLDDTNAVSSLAQLCAWNSLSKLEQLLLRRLLSPNLKPTYFIRLLPLFCHPVPWFILQYWYIINLF